MGVAEARSSYSLHDCPHACTGRARTAAADDSRQRSHPHLPVRNRGEAMLLQCTGSCRETDHVGFPAWASSCLVLAPCPIVNCDPNPPTTSHLAHCPLFSAPGLRLPRPSMQLRPAAHLLPVWTTSPFIKVTSSLCPTAGGFRGDCGRKRGLAVCGTATGCQEPSGAEVGLGVDHTR